MTRQTQEGAGGPGTQRDTRRRVLRGLGLASGAGMLSACALGGRDSGERAPSAAPTGSVRYTYSFADQPALTDMERYLGTFNEQQGGKLRVEGEPVRWNGPADYSAKIIALFAGGSAPDALRLTFHMVPDLAKKSALYDLGTLLRRDAKEVQPDDFYPSGLEAGQHAGKQYGLAGGGGPGLLVYYNEDAVKRLGLEPPDVAFEKGRWTYETALDYGKRMTAREGDVVTRPGFVIGPLVNYPAESILWGFGGSVFSKDGTQCTLNSAQSLEGLQWYADRAQRDRITQFGIPPGKNLVNDVIMSGDVGMVSWNSNFGVTLKARGAAFPWNVAPFPSGPRTGSGATSGNSPSPDAIAAPTNNPEGAWAFMKWFFSKDTLTLRRSAARRSMKDKLIEYSDNLADKSGARLLPAATEKTKPFQRPAGNAIDIQTAFTTGLNAILNGQVAVRDGAESMVREVDELIRSAA